MLIYFTLCIIKTLQLVNVEIIKHANEYVKPCS